MNNSKSIGVYWDYENVQVWEEGAHIPLAERILDLLKKKGYFKILQVYGKWSPHDNILKGLYSLGFKPIFVPMTAKNSADIKLAVDCVASSYENDIDIYVIISADKDFIPVITHLKSIGKEVIIVANKENSSDYITISPDQYISIESIMNKDEAKKLENAVNKYIASVSRKSRPQKIPKKSKDIEYDELKSILTEILQKSVKNGVILNVSKIHTELQIKSKNRYISYSKVIGPNGKKYSNFKDLLLDMLDGNNYEMVNDEVAKKSKLKPDPPSPIIQGWISFLENIEIYLHSKSNRASIFSRLNLINQLQKSLLTKQNIDLQRSEINDKIELLINVGLLEEDQDLNFKLASSFKAKKEAFIKSFNTPTKQSSLIETLP